MNKTLAISAITLVAVVMGMSLVIPALAHDAQGHKGILVEASPCRFLVTAGNICVAPDRGIDGT